MRQKIKIQIAGIKSLSDKNFVETELEVLGGVESINIDESGEVACVDFDDSQISLKEIFEKIINLGFAAKEIDGGHGLQEHTYFVKGMHCASCEIIIEKELLKIKGVRSVEASTSKGRVVIEYDGLKPGRGKINDILRKYNYAVFNYPVESRGGVKHQVDFSTIFWTAVLAIIGLILVKKLGLAGLINVNSSSSLPAFFTLGILAGVSSCAALVGGLVLSMSKQWLDLYSGNDSVAKKMQPHLMFNAGRIASFAVLGAGLGALGSQLQISLAFNSILIIAVSVIMIFLALQMLGVKAFRQFQFTIPKFITRYIADESNFKGRHMPFTLGAFTFFLPCGFTITAQGLALVSGNPIQGGLIMMFFALGTFIPLLLIGFSSVKFSQRQHQSEKFLQIAGVLVLLFAFYNINNQLNVLGLKSASDISFSLPQNNISTSQRDIGAQAENLAPIINGKQLLKMEALAYGYKPDYFRVKADIPIRWEIKDIGTSGCANAIISRGLFNGQINLTPGKTSVKEFTPSSPGKYKFSCWMGMVSGVIEVVN